MSHELRTRLRRLEEGAGSMISGTVVWVYEREGRITLHDPSWMPHRYDWCGRELWSSCDDGRSFASVEEAEAYLTSCGVRIAQLAVQRLVNEPPN